jgi:putative transposase
MPDVLFNNRYRISSSRLPCWDYGKSGWYFVTICTQDRNPFFGEIVGGTMRLSPMGLVVRRCWAEIPKHFPNAQLDEYAVMPDHIHGIIVITQQTAHLVDTGCVEMLQCNVSTTKQRRMSGISPKPGSLPIIIRSFKSACSYMLHKIKPDALFMWQSRYHDRIIRNDDELEGIRKYIHNNAIKHGIQVRRVKM